MSLDDIMSKKNGEQDSNSNGNAMDAQGTKRKNGQGQTPLGRRLFVGNLAFKTSWQDLKDHFKTVGNVSYANVMRESRDSNRSKSKGWGIVEFETLEEAAAAIEQLND